MFAGVVGAFKLVLLLSLDTVLVRAARVDTGVCARVRLEEGGEKVLSSSFTKIVKPRLDVEVTSLLVAADKVLVVEGVAVGLLLDADAGVEEDEELEEEDPAEEEDDRVLEVVDEEDVEAEAGRGEASDEKETSLSVSPAAC